MGLRVGATETVQLERRRAVSAIERRVFYRLPIPLPVRYQIQFRGVTSARLDGVTINLSAGGMLLQCELPDEETLNALIAGDAELLWELDLPGATGRVRGRSRAAWSERGTGFGPIGKIGLQFVQIDPDAQQRIHDVVVLLSD